MDDSQNLASAVAEAIGQRLVDDGLVSEMPDVTLMPWYDNVKDPELKVCLVPSNITTDARVARGIVKEIFATQVVIFKYLPNGNIGGADEAMRIAERLSTLFAGTDLVVGDLTLNINAVVMFGATEILWNGDWQIDGLIKQETLAESDVFSSSFVVIASRYIVS